MFCRVLTHGTIGRASHRRSLFHLHRRTRTGRKRHALPGKAKNDPEQQEMAEQELYHDLEMLLGGRNVNSGRAREGLSSIGLSRRAFITTGTKAAPSRRFRVCAPPLSRDTRQMPRTRSQRLQRPREPSALNFRGLRRLPLRACRYFPKLASPFLQAHHGMRSTLL